MSKTLVDKNTGNIITREVNNSNPDINLSETQISNTVRYAVEQSLKLEEYDAEALAETDKWIIRLSETQSVDSIAGQLGVETFDETRIIHNTYVFEFPQQQTTQEIFQSLEDVAEIEFFYPLVEQERPNRFAPNDPFYAQQWHLNNTGQTGGTAGADANVEDAWDTVLGDGVVIGIVDDGLQHTHPDLSNQYRADLSFDFVGNDADPSPGSQFDAHGTSAAGIAAASGDNNIGVSGAAPNASLAGLRLLGPGMTDLTESQSLSYSSQEIDVYSNSWGPPDDGTLGSAGPLTLAALENGVNQGRNGLGNIYVWAAGNGLTSTDNVNYDGYANSRYTIAVTAIDHNSVQSEYSEPGAPILVAAHSSGDGVGTTTTDLLGSAGYNGIAGNLNYTNDFGGTSSAAPLASGVVALMLDANPNLTWRDVQHILVDTASQNDPTDTDWVTNGAGHLVNHKYGFGAIDADAAVTTALSWTNVEPEDITFGDVTVAQTIPDNDPTGLSSTISITDDLDVEWVEVVFDAEHDYRGNLEITLTSPDGTESILAEQRSDSGDDYDNWVFTSARHWDESSLGDWTLTVADTAGFDIGTWNSWELNVYGTGTGIGDDNYEPNNTLATAYDITGDEQIWLEDIDGLGVANNEDWYKIETGSGFENLMINLQFTHADGDLDLILHDSNGNEIARSESISDNEQINVPAPQGIYYLEVYPYSSSDAGNTYDLWWDDVADLDDDNYEPNNTLETAYDITGDEQTWLENIDGLGVANNPDWYKLETGSGFENLMINLQFTHADGDIDMALYDASGNYITGAASVTDNEQINVAAPAGIYYLEVSPDSAVGNTYDLWWDDVATL